MADVQVLVECLDQERVLPETFRCLLNNRDITDRLTLGRNGAGGQLYGLVQGSDLLGFEVFGRGWWPWRWSPTRIWTGRGGAGGSRRRIPGRAALTEAVRTLAWPGSQSPA